MIYKDYYKILDLKTSRVSIDEIKVAYRAAAKKYHPDLNVGDSLAEERIKDINEAYRTLSVPASKRKYDRIWNSRNNINNYQKIKGKNIFNMFLGNTEINEETDRKLPQRGEDIETEINVKLEEAFYGLEKKISLRTVDGKMKTFSVKVPDGIRNGEKIRLIGQGKTGKNGGKNGDLFIKINIENSKTFKLFSSDLYTDLLLTPWEAALGTRTSVQTIDGETTIYIPQGMESGEKIKIPNKGYKDGKGGRGDLVAEIKIVVPKKLTEEENNLFEKLKEVSKFSPRNSVE
ncbi:MAG: DnaJ C-terminal domain-containing protein [Clostridia bacterium]